MVKDICVRDSFTDKDGNEKTLFNKIGILIEKGDKTYTKLFHMPGVICSNRTINDRWGKCKQERNISE